ncbi:MAG: secondary thiamine-phosphate synthase enzyme YjbQ [Elusimicrobiota bacterium]
MQFFEYGISTKKKSEMIDITGIVNESVAGAGIAEGSCVVFIPHTTAGVTINENADPDVIRDILMLLDESVPWQHRAYRHSEGNSAAHIKSSFMGSSIDLMVRDGRVRLGTWQSVFFCEFDGPRSRKVWIKVS